MRVMHSRTLQIGLALAAGVFIMTTALRTQPLPAVGPVWEYSAITYTPGGGTSICYASADGCRYERVSNSNQAGETAMIAAARLGEKGWELATASEGGIDSKGQRTLYFKRLRSVLNRSESPGAR